MSLKKKIFMTSLLSFIMLFYLTLFVFFKTDILTHLQQYITIQSAVKNIQRCNRTSSKDICIYQAFVKLTKKNDIAVSMSVLNDLQTKRTVSECHFIAHLIGQTEVAKHPTRWKEKLGQIDPNKCGGGFLHGAIEEVIAQKKLQRIDASVISDICPHVGRQDGDVNCMHTMGHIILLETGGNLTQSIKLCEEFVPGIEGKSFQCYRGLFMEYTTKLNAKLHNLTFAEKKIDINEINYLESLCAKQKNTSSLACWEQIARYYLTYSKNDDNLAFPLCKRAKRTLYVNTCQMSMGNFVITSPSITKQNMNGAIDRFCSHYASNTVEQNQCRLQLIATLLSESFTNTPTLIKFCETSENNFKNACFLKIGSMLSLSDSQSTRQKYCALAPKEYSNHCLFKDMLISS